MYSIQLNSGIVIRTSDLVQVAPCQDTSDPNYLEYVAWVNDGHQPEVVNETLITAKLLAKENIARDCDTEMQSRNYGLISTAIGAKIDCREIDILRISQLTKLMELQGAPETATINFICYGNVIRQGITFTQIKQALVELTTNMMNMLYRKHTLYAYLAAATTVAQVEGVVWSWPPA